MLPIAVVIIRANIKRNLRMGWNNHVIMKEFKPNSRPYKMESKVPKRTLFKV